MIINDSTALNSIYNTLLSKALNSTMNIALNKLQEYIQDEVYNSYDPVWYERTNELLNNWDYTQAQIKNGLLESELSFSKPIMHSGEPLFQHGMSEIDNNVLAEIVNDGKIGAICNFPLLGSRPFWESFEKWCNLELVNTFINQCKLLGLEITTDVFSYTI